MVGAGWLSDTVTHVCRIEREVMTKYTVIGFTLLLCASLYSQSGRMHELERRMQQQIEISFRNESLRAALSLISKETGIRISHGDLILPSAKIPQFSQRSTCEDIIQKLLDTAELTYVPQQDGSIRLVEVQQIASIYGNVLDLEGSSPLPSANIFLENTSLGAASDQNGSFMIREIPAGIYTMRVQFIGYKPQVFRINLERGKSVGLNVLMDIDPVQMDEISVEAEAHQDIIHKEEISSFTLKPRQLELQPSHGEKDLLRTIQILPGVTATNEYKSQFYIRGGNSDQNLVLMNGGVLYNPFHFSGILSAFDTDALEKADVYLGGFSAEYGGRLSSVLDIRTRRGGDKLRGQLNISPISNKLLIEFPDKKHWDSMILSFRRSNVNLFSRKIGGRVEPDFYDLIINQDIHPPGRMAFSFTAFLSNDKVTYQRGENSNPITSDSKLLTLNIERFHSDRLTFQSDLSFGIFSSSLPPSQGIGESTKNKLRDYSVTFKAEWEANDNFKLTTGIDYRRINAKYQSSDLIISEISSDETSFNRSFYIQTTLKLTDKFDISNGIRLQSYRSYKSFLVEPRMGARYKINDYLSIKGNYGRFSQNLVTIYNENDTYNPVDIWLSPPSSLKHATSNHLIFGFDYKTGVVNFTTEVYWKTYVHLTHYNRERLSDDDPSFVQGTGDSKGLDISVQVLKESWQILSSYSLGKATKELPFRYPEPHISEFSPRYDRRHNFNLNFSAKPAEKFEISSKFTVGTGLPFTFITGYYVRLPGENINPTSDYVGDGEGDPEDYLLGIKSDINAFRFPTYHRLDISARYTTSWGRFGVEPYLLFLNVYNQKNVLFYDSKGIPNWSLAFLPMVGVEFEF
jgi:outer membrane cobalamin receptor